MWELYTFWAFVPVILAYSLPQLSTVQISFYSFCVIGAGAVGCVGGGYLSQRFGSAKVAFVQLLLSGLCCLAAVFILQVGSTIVILAFLVLWGVVVAGDSPQFSALSARTAPSHLVGTALTIVTSIGFALTIVSIQFTAQAIKLLPLPVALALLAIGPVLGLLSLKKLVGR
jgi:MFS family permease